MSVRTLVDRGRGLAARNGRPLRFAIAGVANTAFGLGVYPLLLWSSDWLYRHYMVGLGIAQITSLCFAFCTYKLALSAGGRGGIGEIGREVGLFSSFYLVAFALNWLALPVLVGGVALDPVAAQVGFALVTMIASYFWHSRVTFRPVRDR